jgi:hypothetical protein
MPCSTHPVDAGKPGMGPNDHWGDAYFSTDAAIVGWSIKGKLSLITQAIRLPCWTGQPDPPLKGGVLSVRVPGEGQQGGRTGQ